MSALKAKIVSMLQNFTYSENEIAQYILDNMEDVATSSITVLAEKTNTSEASINRFCKKLGYKGFNNFKIALVQERFYQEQNRYVGHTKQTFIESVNADYTDLLGNTASLIRENDILQTVHKISTATNVYILSTYRTKYIGMQLERRLLELGIRCRMYCDLTEIRTASVHIEDNDMVLVISNSILVNDMFVMLRTLKDRGIFITAFTNYDSSKLPHAADVSIIVSDKIACSNSMVITNDIAFLFAFDLVIGMLITNNKQYKQKRMETDNVLNYLESADRNLIDIL